MSVLSELLTTKDDTLYVHNLHHKGMEAHRIIPSQSRLQKRVFTSPFLTRNIEYEISSTFFTC